VPGQTEEQTADADMIQRARDVDAMPATRELVKSKTCAHRLQAGCQWALYSLRVHGRIHTLNNFIHQTSGRNSKQKNKNSNKLN